MRGTRLVDGRERIHVAQRIRAVRLGGVTPMMVIGWGTAGRRAS
ncbi:MAG: hypothetical protein ABJF01_24920 [bacterium]